MQEYQTRAIRLTKHFGPNGTVLRIAFVNPPFLKEESGWGEKAQEIAHFASEHYAEREELVGISVVFTTARSMGLTFSSSRTFTFSMQELAEPSDRDVIKQTQLTQE